MRRSSGHVVRCRLHCLQRLQRRHASSSRMRVDGVKHVVGVSSGKGGVGKSTVTVNLGAALTSQGHSVGILDADVYGPSIPALLGLSGLPETDQEKRIIPPESYGMRVMSCAFFLPDSESPVVWRGPMVTSALNQMLHQVRWGSLDYLLVDFPPGTGDIHLTMAQQVAMSGAIVVSTPQDLALLSAVKGINMFHKVNVPILGLVENMSFHRCSSCGHVDHVFGHHGAKERAAAMGVPFLGEVPLLTDVRSTSDSGTPIVLAQPDSDTALTFASIAKQVHASVQQHAMEDEVPIVIQE